MDNTNVAVKFSAVWCLEHTKSRLNGKLLFCWERTVCHQVSIEISAPQLIPQGHCRRSATGKKKQFLLETLTLTWLSSSSSSSFVPTHLSTPHCPRR